MEKRRRRYFTLIEILLSIAILTILGGVLLFNAPPMLDYYRFTRGVAHLKQEIDLTRRLSRVACTDVEFYIEQKAGGLFCRRTTDEPLSLPNTFDRPIFISHLRMKGARELLSFTASGWIKEEKQLTITLKDKTTTFTLSNRITPTHNDGN